jgi:cbb3-type cytochrome oxidase subunit 3
MSDFVTIAAWARHYGVALMTLVFVLIFITTYWPSRRAKLEEHGQIPLNDDRQGG